MAPLRVLRQVAKLLLAVSEADTQDEVTSDDTNTTTCEP